MKQELFPVVDLQNKSAVISQCALKENSKEVTGYNCDKDQL